ncbi:MAG TPA: hypothetical protein VK436_10470 [Methanocella sp.]|nr:hypothetical protein [Methanocella sp.]
MGISLSMNCPNCGGDVSVEEGVRYTSCKYCSAILSIEGDEGVNRITFRNKLNRDRAIDAVRQWWRGGFKARDLRRRGEITECYPIYVPFWRLKARASGWVCGYKVVQREKRTERVPLEKMVTRDFDWSQVASDAGDIGIEHLRNFEGEAIILDEGSIPTFEATTSSTDAKARGMSQIESEAVSYAGVPHVTFKKVHVIPVGLSLIFYPVWMIRYKYADRMYFATVDGITGYVLSGRAPGDYLWRSITMAVGMAVGGTGIGFSLWLGIAIHSQGSVALMLFLMAACLAIAAGSFGFFRYGSEMTTGDVKGGYNLFKNHKDAEDTAFEKIAPALFGR